MVRPVIPTGNGELEFVEGRRVFQFKFYYFLPRRVVLAGEAARCVKIPIQKGSYLAPLLSLQVDPHLCSALCLPEGTLGPFCSQE